MKVDTGGNLGLSREYHKKLFGPLSYTWWNCPLTIVGHTMAAIGCSRWRPLLNIIQLKMFLGAKT